MRARSMVVMQKSINGRLLSLLCDKGVTAPPPLPRETPKYANVTQRFVPLLFICLATLIEISVTLMNMISDYSSPPLIG